MCRHNAVLERHGEGSYINDWFEYMEAQTVKTFVDWLMIGRPTAKMIEDGTALATATRLWDSKRAKTLIELLSDDRLYKAISDGLSN
ncbi:hypothetical protein FKM82_015571 [Ascaphus truei]